MAVMSLDLQSFIAANDSPKAQHGAFITCLSWGFIVLPGRPPEGACDVERYDDWWACSQVLRGPLELVDSQQTHIYANSHHISFGIMSPHTDNNMQSVTPFPHDASAILQREEIQLRTQHLPRWNSALSQLAIVSPDSPFLARATS